MTLLEPIIVMLIGVAAGALATALKKNRGATVFLKYGPIVKKAYDIIDPLLDQHLRNWNGSQVDKAFEVAVETAGDGQLSQEDIKEIAFYMAKAWLPQKAADKARRLEAASRTAPELIAAAKVAARVNSWVH